jgi:Tol biopolymer transport system component
VLTWFDQQGNPTGTMGDLGDYNSPAISPNGTHVAVARGSDIWILDVDRGTSTRFTFDPARDDFPAWSHDGRQIVFTSNRGGLGDLYIKPADGSNEEKLLLKTDGQSFRTDWTRDGRFVVFSRIGTKTAQDLWALPVPSDSTPVPLLQTQYGEYDARVSPDGRWLAYRSDESGLPEIYVRPFDPSGQPGGGAKFLVSRGGPPSFPIWRNSKQLYYVTADNDVMAIDIDTSNGFLASTPRRLFTARGVTYVRGWDLSPDGKRFLFVTPTGAGKVTPFTVVLNWAAGLKK